MRRRLFSAALAGLPFASLAGASRALAQADDWPNRNVRIVCPFTPGGSQDNIARRLAAKLGDAFGQSFVVENRTGAGGSIAADNVVLATGVVPESRLADALAGSTPSIFTAMSASGNAVWLSGQTVRQYQVGTNGAIRMGAK